jgi:hypothetical protein
MDILNNKTVTATGAAGILARENLFSREMVPGQ